MKRKYRHKGYSLIKPFQVARYLSATRRALIRDIGGTEDNLSAQQVILIDGCINILGIIRSMELYISKTEVMKGQNLAPCLRNSYLQYRNSLHRALNLLGLDKQESDTILSIEQLKDVVDREADEKEAKKKPRKS